MLVQPTMFHITCAFRAYSLIEEEMCQRGMWGLCGLSKQVWELLGSTHWWSNTWRRFHRNAMRSGKSWLVSRRVLSHLSSPGDLWPSTHMRGEWRQWLTVAEFDTDHQSMLDQSLLDTGAPRIDCHLTYCIQDPMKLECSYSSLAWLWKVLGYYPR